MTDAAKQPLEGVEITLGNQKFIAPVLSLGRVKKALPLLETIENAGGEKLTARYIDAAVGFVHLALAPNYPDLTPEAIEDLIDLRNMKTDLPALIRTVMDASGLVATGEAEAGTA